MQGLDVKINVDKVIEWAKEFNCFITRVNFGLMQEVGLRGRTTAELDYPGMIVSLPVLTAG